VDIGAGCGSIAIEWLRIGEGRSAIAVEQDPSRAAMIARNAASLGSRHCASCWVPHLMRWRVCPRECDLRRRGITRPACCRRRGRPCAGGRLVANVVTAEARRGSSLACPHGGALTRIAVSRAMPVGPHHFVAATGDSDPFAVVKAS